MKRRNVKLRILVAVALGVIAVLILALPLILNAASQSLHPLAIAMGLIFGTAFVTIPRIKVDSLIREIDALRLALPVFAYLLIAGFVGDSPGSLAFHEVASQIIVVLLLALAIEARFFRLRSARDPSDVRAMLFTMAALAAGEYMSLNSVGTEHPKNAGLVAGAIAAGFTAVAASAFVAPADSREQDDRSNP